MVIWNALNECNREIQHIQATLTNSELNLGDDVQISINDLKNRLQEVEALASGPDADLKEVKDGITLLSTNFDEFVTQAVNTHNVHATAHAAVVAQYNKLIGQLNEHQITSKKLIDSMVTSYHNLLGDFLLLKQSITDEKAGYQIMLAKVTLLEQQQPIDANDLRELNAMADKLRSDIDEMKESLSLVTGFKRDIGALRNEMKQRIARRERRISIYRDLMYMTMYTSNNYLSSIYLITMPITLSVGILPSTVKYNSMAVSMYIDPYQKNEGFRILVNGSKVVQLLVTNEDMQIRFQYASSKDIVIKKDTWKQDTIPILVLSLHGSDNDFYSSSDVSTWLDVAIYEGNRDTGKEIAPTKIGEVSKLTLPYGIHNGTLQLEEDGFNGRCYFTRMLSTQIDSVGVAEATLHHVSYSKLNEALLTAHEFDDDATIDNPFSQIVRDVEKLMVTTVRSRYGDMHFGNAGNPSIIINMIPDIAGYGSPVPLINNYDPRLDGGVHQERKYSLRMTGAMPPAGSATLFPVTLKYDDEPDKIAMNGTVMCRLLVDVRKSEAWIGCEGTTLAEGLKFEAGKFGNECGSTLTRPTMVMHIRSSRYVVGYVFKHTHKIDRGVMIKCRLPVSIALPSVSISEKEADVELHANGEVIGRSKIQWNSVNVVEAGMQRVELQGTIDILDALRTQEINVVMLNNSFDYTGWSSVNAIADGAQTDKDYPSSGRVTSAGTVSFIGRLKEKNRCKYWHHMTVNFNAQKYGQLKNEDALLKQNGLYAESCIITNGGMTYKGWPVTVRFKTGSLRCGFLQDPIGLGTMTLIDYEKMKLNEQMQSLAMSVMDIKRAVDSQEERLKIVEKTFEVSKQSTLKGIMTVVLSVGSVIAPYLGILANVTYQLLSASMRIIDIVEAGFDQSSIMTIIYEMYLTISVIRMMKHETNSLSTINRKIYDISKTASNEISKRIESYKATKQMDSVGLNKISMPSGDVLKLKSPPVKGVASDVEHVVRPLEGMNLAGNHFAELAKKMTAGTASVPERLLFHKLRDAHILPMHNYLRFTSYSGTHKHVDILGVSDGYAANYGGGVSTHLLGNNRFQAIKIKSDGSGGLGAWRMRMEKVDGSWKLSDPRSSGMTDYEILCAVGMSHSNASHTIATTNKDVLSRMVNWAYEQKSKEYLSADNHYAIDKRNIMLLPGQFEAVHNAIRSSSGAYNYTLVRNNCQKFTDDILKLLSNTAFKPKWMSSSVHSGYVNNLEHILVSSDA
uniref:Putative RNA-binding protein n=1 Tax=Atrato Reo-like virus TaxID=2689356 RepID=A0A6B9KGG8_9REOV|nr:putative RNA-binding protein [Atrato Reo-like virus]